MNDALQQELTVNGLTAKLGDIITGTDYRIPKGSKIKVISLDGIKKLADYFGIVIKENPQFPVQPTDGNRQQHIRGMWLGFKGDSDRDNWIFSEGEASQLNTGKVVTYMEDGVNKAKHQEKGDIAAEYKSNMAFKRAYTRGVIRLTNLYGFYAEAESKSFENTEAGVSVNYDNV